MRRLVGLGGTAATATALALLPGAAAMCGNGGAVLSASKCAALRKAVAKQTAAVVANGTGNKAGGADRQLVENKLELVEERAKTDAGAVGAKERSLQTSGSGIRGAVYVQEDTHYQIINITSKPLRT